MGSSVSIPQTDQTRVIALLDQAKSTGGNTRLNALQELWNLADNNDYKTALCHPSLNLLPTLRGILESNLRDVEVCNKVTGVLWYLSRQSVCGELIASSESNLLPVLMNLVHPSSRHRRYDYYTQIMKIFTNLSLNSLTHRQLLHPDLQWLPFIYNELVNNPDDVRSYCIFSNFLLTAKQSDNVEGLVQLGVPTIIVKKLIALGPNPAKWALRREGIPSWCISFTTNLSCFASGIASLRQLNPLAFLQQLMTVNSLEGIKATIIIANVYGKDENNSYAKALLVDHESILTSLLDLFHFTIHYDKSSEIVKRIEATGFQFAELSLRSIVSSLKNLSISDENKKVMIKFPVLLRYACDAIDSFVKNREEYGVYVLRAVEKAGGGGQDFEVVQSLLELLLQLSFYYDEDSVLQSSFRVEGCDLKELLQSLLALPAQRNLPFEARQFASRLLSRLQSTPKPIIPTQQESKEVVTPQKQPTRQHQHIMLSYSWAKNKPLVVALGKKLRELGYDVWRDEEGSSLVPAISGDITESMAEAIMHSFAVVILVSPEYKESVNCRAEAKYARAREFSHNLRLIYVMVDQNYHTRSPQAVDGWLGFMIGSDLWYPLWTESHVDSTAEALRELIGEQAKTSGDQSCLKLSAVATASPPAALPPPSSTSSSTVAAVPVPAGKQPDSSAPSSGSGGEGELDYAKAWDCLSNSVRVQDPVALKNLLEELGVVDLSDFEGVEPQYFESIANLLKPAPQKNFRKALRMI